MLKRINIPSGNRIWYCGDQERIEQMKQQIARARTHGFSRHTEVWVGLRVAADQCRNTGVLVSQAQLREWEQELSRVCALLPGSYHQCPAGALITRFGPYNEYLRCVGMAGHSELHYCFTPSGTSCWSDKDAK